MLPAMASSHWSAQLTALTTDGLFFLAVEWPVIGQHCHVTASYCWHYSAMQLPGLCMEFKSVRISTLADMGGESQPTQQMSAALIGGEDVWNSSFEFVV